MNSGRQGGFHRKHGTNIRLSEENTIAHRTDSYNNSVVFTEQPIAVGNTFLVELLDKGGGWAGSIVSWGHTNTSLDTALPISTISFSFQRFGMTTQCPDDIAVPSGALDLYRSSHYWILSASTVHNNGQERKMDLNLESVRVGQTIGCSVNKDGELHYFVDGKDRGIGWTGLPIDVPLWGFADIYGLARKIKSLFIFGEFLCSM